MPLGPPMGPILILILIIILIFSTFFKLKIAEKSYTPPPFFEMVPYDPELIFKVYIPVFRPPGHYIDGLGLYYQFNLNVKKKSRLFLKSKIAENSIPPPLF